MTQNGGVTNRGASNTFRLIDACQIPRRQYTFIRIYLRVESANKNELFYIAIEIGNESMFTKFIARDASAMEAGGIDGQLILGTRIEFCQSY